ncbi:hypothetical protein [Luteolibacter sp. LG18]|uniref:hypothetical protein n=1 Tax=Luteolibacter sp. LG18 TaxID=2819286 RepID=UPI0030C728D0
MPFTGPVSFLPLADEFLVHWAAVDAALGVNGPLLLQGRIDRAALVDLRARLELAQAAVAKARVTRAAESEDLHAQDAVLARRLEQFNQRVPMAKICGNAEDARALWQEIDLKGEPFLLPTEYTRLDFVTDISARRLMHLAHTAADRALTTARGHRDEYLDQVHAFAEIYREKLPEVLPANHELVKTMPVLNLPRGQNPEPVEARAGWVGNHVRIEWEPSHDPALSHYDVRCMAGAEYENEDERSLGRVTAGGECRFEVASDLEELSTVASFRVYTVLSCGHERGSQPVTVKRH